MIRVLVCIGLMLCILGGYFLTPFIFGVIFVWFRILRYEFLLVGILSDVMMRDNESLFVFPMYFTLALLVMVLIPMVQKYIFSSGNLSAL